MKKLILGVATLMAVCFTSCEEEDISMFHVNFDTNGGTNIECQIVEEGDTAITPNTPTKESVEFINWSLNGETYDFSTIINSDITLTANWTAPVGMLQVTFDSNGGSIIEGQYVEQGQSALTPEAPTKDNSFFMYWMLNDSAYDFSSKVDTDIILTAKWQTNWQPTGIVNFEDILLNETGLEQNNQISGSILSGVAAVSCAWTVSDWGTYGSGFSITNHNDTETPGYGNAYSCIAGSGAYGSQNFAINYGTGDSIKFEESIDMESVMLCNNTYAYLSMRDGDAFAKKFNSEDEDYFKLTLHLYGEDGKVIGSEDFYLADFRGNAAYIVNTWTELNLAGYEDVSYIKFSFESTDTSSYGGYNTPTYFCIDNIEYTK